MKINQIVELLEAKIITSICDLSQDVETVFASDLMSDVLTVDVDKVLLLTGLNNIQTVRTAEVADIGVVMIARGKEITPDMIALAEENNIVLLECKYSLFKTSGILYENGVKPVY